MDRKHRPLLFLFLSILLQGQSLFCHPTSKQDNGENFDALNNSQEEGLEIAHLSTINTRDLGREIEGKAEIVKEIEEKIAEKELLMKERQTYLKAERKKNLEKTENLKEQFLEEEAKQKADRKRIQQEKKKWEVYSQKTASEIRQLKRVISLLSQRKNKQENTKKLNQKLSEQEEKKKAYEGLVKAISDEKKARVTELQKKADQRMAERNKKEIEVEREIAEMDEVMKNLDGELKQLRADLKKAQS